MSNASGTAFTGVPLNWGGRGGGEGEGDVGSCTIVNHKGLHCSQINWKRVRGERGGETGLGLSPPGD